ncbi:MAG: hypothetical protein K8S18_19755, partial [Desulfobacula sp.]|nr:hypothetical protein [Desulfobacula sp.]
KKKVEEKETTEIDTDAIEETSRGITNNSKENRRQEGDTKSEKEKEKEKKDKNKKGGFFEKYNPFNK